MTRPKSSTRRRPATPARWTRAKADLKQRLLTFEAFNGAFVFLPWGAGFVYCGLFDLRLGYSYGMLSLGVVLIVWGLRKLTVNRVKQQVKVERAVQAELEK